jgi:hypothetical protein
MTLSLSPGYLDCFTGVNHRRCRLSSPLVEGWLTTSRRPTAASRRLDRAYDQERGRLDSPTNWSRTSSPKGTPAYAKSMPSTSVVERMIGLLAASREASGPVSETLLVVGLKSPRLARSHSRVGLGQDAVSWMRGIAASAGYRESGSNSRVHQRAVTLLVRCRESQVPALSSLSGCSRGRIAYTWPFSAAEAL